MSKLQKNLPPLEWIRVFEAAGRTGSFTRAAAEIGLTQAAVSQRIRNLEAHIGTRLFDRQARGVTLTLDGEVWLPYVANALNALGRSADDLFAKPLKRIRVLGSASVIELWFAPRLKTVRPNCQLSFQTLHTGADYVREGAEVQIRHGNGQWPEHRTMLLFREALTPMVTPQLLAEVKGDWTKLPHIAVSGPRPGWMEWATLANSPAPPIPPLRFDSFSQALAAAKNGAGVLLGSLPLCQPELAQGQLQRPSKVVLHANDSYWMTSIIGDIPLKQWQSLAGFADASANTIQP